VITAAISALRSFINVANVSTSSLGTWTTSGTSGPYPVRLGAMPCALVPP